MERDKKRKKLNAFSWSWVLSKDFFYFIVLAVLKTILLEFVDNLAHGLMHAHHAGDHGFNYREWVFPSVLRGVFKVSIDKKRFIAIGLMAFVCFIFIFSLEKWYGETVKIKTSFRLRGLLAEKFRRLPLEEREAAKTRLFTLYTEDVYTVKNYLADHSVKYASTFVSLGMKFLLWWDKITTFTLPHFFLLKLITFLLIVSVFYVIKRNIRTEKKFRSLWDSQWKLLNKQGNHYNLIDSMGMGREFQAEYEKEQKMAEALHKKALSLRLYEAYPAQLVKHLLPFLIYWLGGETFMPMVIHVVVEVLEKIEGLLYTQRESQICSVSYNRLLKFFRLTEWDNNLSALCLPNTVGLKRVVVRDLNFAYRGQERPVLYNHRREFLVGVNHLSGRNGAGKSTLIYLLLGVLRPSKGQIILELNDGRTYDLHHDINLLHWREKNVVFLAHQTLLEEGSTGERQWKSIKRALVTRREALFWVFDEANSAIDRFKNTELERILKELTEEGKIIVYVRHKGN